MSLTLYCTGDLCLPPPASLGLHRVFLETWAGASPSLPPLRPIAARRHLELLTKGRETDAQSQPLPSAPQYGYGNTVVRIASRSGVGSMSSNHNLIHGLENLSGNASLGIPLWRRYFSMRITYLVP